MKLLTEKTLKDGRRLQVWRHVFPDDGFNAPAWLLDLFKFELPQCWHSYYDGVFTGQAENCRDFLYAGVVDGVPASRMWFGYSLRTKAGNFGNVITLPEYRRLGIMRSLLECLADDFQHSDALFCSCDAADTAAPAYASVGFQRIFGDGFHPMAIVHTGSMAFPEIAETAYADTTKAQVRTGTLCDRFDCDKLLAYVPSVYGKIERCPEVPDYLTLWPMVLRGETDVRVLEAASGFCAGYAFSCRGTGYCVLHPAFSAYRADLMQ